MPEGAHPLPLDDIPEWELKVINEDFMRREAAMQDQLPRGRGWAGIPSVKLDGQNWTLDFAARMLEIPEKDLRDLVRITGLQPAGVLNMRPYRSQGRTPRAYPAAKLIMISETLADLRESLNFPDSADSA